jgi:hypothetical protein
MNPKTAEHFTNNELATPVQRGLRAVSWQPSPEKWATYLAPTPDQVLAIIRRVEVLNRPAKARAHPAAKRRRGVSE